ncbi:MAG: sulfotransferase [Marmoricola sp.]
MRSGWRLVSAGAESDVCPWCQWLSRRGRARPRFEPLSPRAGAAERLPDLLIIGAAKAGTTSLHYYLNSHPDIAMAEFKELRYYQDPRCREWLGRYRASFPADAKLVGESSTMYTRSPTVPGVAERIAEIAPDVKLIYMVRDPVERAFASYLEERFQGLETRDVESAFADRESPLNPYLAGSRYAEQVNEYLKFFPPTSLHIVSMTELDEHPQDVLSQVCAYLGVDDTFVFDTSHRHNQGSAKYQYRRLSRRLRDSSPGRAVRMLPDPARRVITAPARALLRTPFERPGVSDDLRAAAAELLAPDAQAFRALTGQAFDDWSV